MSTGFMIIGSISLIGCVVFLAMFFYGMTGRNMYLEPARAIVMATVFLAVFVFCVLQYSRMQPEDADGAGESEFQTAAETESETAFGGFRFTWSGGSGRISISCTDVTEENGEYQATLHFENTSGREASFDRVRVNGTVYEGKNTFTIPVILNEDMSIEGRTTAMSEPHWITYTIRIGEAGTEAQQTDWNVLDETAPGIEGLTAEEDQEAAAAEHLRIFRYRGGIRLLEEEIGSGGSAGPGEAAGAAEAKDTESVETEPADAEGAEQMGAVPDPYRAQVLRYLVLPPGADAPAGLDPHFILIRQPVGSAYVLSESALKILGEMNLLSSVGMTGLEEDELPDELRQAASEKKIENLGRTGSWDLKNMVLKKTSLVIESSDILKDPVSYCDQAQSAVMLDIPMVVDLSGEEQEETAGTAWKTFYGAIFGGEEAA